MRRIKKSERQREVLKSTSGILASAFGIGLLPSAPGTWASVATLAPAWLIAINTGWIGLLIASALVFLLGILVSSNVIKSIEADDPSVIVIDEVAGQLLTLVAAPVSIPAYLVSFFVFRVFDLTKPWPISWIDNELGGGLGAMTDDMLAGAYGFAVIALIVHFGWL